jgi:hypothetical protein
MLSRTRIWWMITIDRYRSRLYYSSGPAEGDFHVDLRGGVDANLPIYFIPLTPPSAP